jgi:hypothetical protein
MDHLPARTVGTKLLVTFCSTSHGGPRRLARVSAKTPSQASRLQRWPVSHGIELTFAVCSINAGTFPGPTPNAVTCQSTRLARFAWVSSTPLGRPVLPEV